MSVQSADQGQIIAQTIGNGTEVRGLLNDHVLHVVEQASISYVMT